uniref:Carboxypeptidase n=1 Tax=Albugo laibachii Nc14 TaxID=890382 RepID=F0WF19_9STRA|nr:serine carboxypeptidaselike family S10 putative [Albugo laibachii Nc14]CCA24388.1 serine carboxypeptidaselike family S10 putative [Albugo laibachii Nc14]|eukprot:CCA24388.1 serine carboxypeptidaselike family S10 putative [Albugo laibachii Nc14]
MVQGCRPTELTPVNGHRLPRTRFGTNLFRRPYISKIKASRHIQYTFVACFLFGLAWKIVPLSLISSRASPTDIGYLASSIENPSISLDARLFVRDEADDLVAFLPGFGAPKEIQYAGLLKLSMEKDRSIFYWFFETRARKKDEDTPLLVWLNGGPGTSSMVGLLTGMGPYRITTNGKLIPNLHTWTNLAHMLFIDQPVGTGYSSVRDDSGYVNNQGEMASQLYQALLLFFQKHPSFRPNPVYICGESYAGKYVSYLAHHIHHQNHKLQDDDTKMQLRGLAIGNGILWPVLQTRSIPDYAIALGLIDSQEFEAANQAISACEEFHRQGRNIDAFRICHSVQTKIYQNAGNPFIYDVRKSQDLYATTIKQLYVYFNDDATRRELHVPLGVTWSSIDGAQYGISNAAPALARHLFADEILDVPIDVTRILLDHYRCLFYAGNLDGSLSNNLGVMRMIDRLAWSGTTQYQQSIRKPWALSGQVVGLVKATGNLTYLVMTNSGHFVTRDSPEASLEMIKQFLLRNASLSE